MKVCDSDWILSQHAFLGSLVHSIAEKALAIAVKRDPYARKEGAGVWNRSRAPHCYGFEYEREFGKPFRPVDASALHRRVWRSSSWWPNLPPMHHFYGQHEAFEAEMVQVLEVDSAVAYENELVERKRRRKDYDLSYNEVRRKHRRQRREQRRRLPIQRAHKLVYH